ncbi:MAG: aquaporin [Planctomycetes bacterium]|nr:aquaporin [Planctomycetota bacterium]
MRRAAAEFFGTFAMVFVGTGAMVVNDVLGGVVGHVGISLAFGLVVMAMIYSLGEVSGAHINPAVTLAFWAAKRFKSGEVAPYLAAQFGGAIAASFLLLLMFGNHANMGATLPHDTVQQAFIMEVVITAILMFVILGVSTGSRESGIMAGAAVGGTVAMASLFAGPVCGASMNPARSLGPALASGNLQHLWIYLTAPVIGALLAVPLSSLIHNRKVERKPT